MSCKKASTSDINKAVHGAIRKTLEDIFGVVVASFILKEAYLSGYDPLAPVTTVDKLFKTLRSLFGRESLLLERAMTDEIVKSLGLEIREFKDLYEIIRTLKDKKHKL